MVKQTALFGALFKTPCGWASAVFTEGERVVRLTLPSSRAYAMAGLEGVRRRPFPLLVQRVNAYFSGERVSFNGFSLELGDCPPFHAVVYRKLHKVPFGKTVTYGELAEMVGKPRSARAVGQAMRLNRIPLIIPCHRVIRTDGSLGDFSGEGGVEMKRKMLELEGAR